MQKMVEYKSTLNRSPSIIQVNRFDVDLTNGLTDNPLKNLMENIAALYFDNPIHTRKVFAVIVRMKNV